MESGEKLYIWQADDWPQRRYHQTRLAASPAQGSHAQSLLTGRLADVSMPLRKQASLSAPTEDVVKTGEIEGEAFNVDAVRWSIARCPG